VTKFDLLAGLMALPISPYARLTIFWLFDTFNSSDREPQYITWLGNDGLAEKLNCSPRTAKRAIAEVIRLGIFKHEIISNDELFHRTRHRPKGQVGRGNEQNHNRFLTLDVERATSVIRDPSSVVELVSDVTPIKAQLVSPVTPILVSDVTPILVSRVAHEPLNSEPLNLEPVNRAAPLNGVPLGATTSRDDWDTSLEQLLEGIQ
jgi:hypothetical protein